MDAHRFSSRLNHASSFSSAMNGADKMAEVPALRLSHAASIRHRYSSGRTSVRYSSLCRSLGSPPSETRRRSVIDRVSESLSRNAHPVMSDRKRENSVLPDPA